MFSIITNLNGHHMIFKRILEFKIGIDKRSFDKRINETTNAVKQIENYLVHSGNAEFYKIVTSKLLDNTIGIIGDKVISRINDKTRYGSLLEAIKMNKKLLKEDSKNKLESLIG